MKKKYQYNREIIESMAEEMKLNSILKNQLFQLKDSIDGRLHSLKYSVTDKEVTPHSGDKHDYYSIGIYAWPNRDTKDGLPWVLDDCKANPFVKTFAMDSIRIEYFSNDIMTLTTLYYIFKEKKYLEKIEELIKIWFIDKDTKMNPNMDYAQAIPGVCTGRGIGLIDARQFIKVINYLEILEEDGLFSEELSVNLKNWFKEFVQWMENSKNGKEEEGALNNHGSWYEAEITTFLSYAGDKDKILSRKERFLEKVKEQFLDNGCQFHEIKRKKAWHYFVFNLEAIFIAYRNIEVLEQESLEEVKNILKESLCFMVESLKNPDSWENNQDEEFYTEILRERKFLPILYEMSKEGIILEEDINFIKEKGKMTSIELLFNTQNDYTVMFPF